MFENPALVWPESIDVCEVGPRDGLQNEKIIFSTQEKVELIEMALDAGIKEIEIGSFVNPKAVPQMADTDEVAKKIRHLDGVDYRALVLNFKGLERAYAAGVNHARLTISVSKSHSLANSNSEPEEVLKDIAKCVDYANKKSLHLSAALAVVFGCAFEGKVALLDTIAIISALTEMGVNEISLSDTSGMGNPRLVYEACLTLRENFPNVDFSLHFHNTRGLGLANVTAGLLAGITKYDASFAGLGGCPFVPGAAGNIATEDLVNMCYDMEIATGLDLDKLVAAGRRAKKLVGHSTDSFVLRAGTSRDLVK